MNAERLRPLLRTIVEKYTLDEAVELIIKLIPTALSASGGNAEPTPPRPLVPDEWYTLREAAGYWQISNESARLAVIHDPEAFPYRMIDNPGRGRKKIRAYLGRAIIQYREKNH